MTSIDDVSELVARANRILDGDELIDRPFVFAPDAAAVYFKQALELDSAYPPALLGLAKCLCAHAAKSAEATAFFEQALQHSPTNAEAHYEFGLHLLRVGEWEDATLGSAYFDESIRHSMLARDLKYPGESWVTHNIGTAYFRKRSFQEAEQWFKMSYEAIMREGSWIPATFFLAAKARIAMNDAAGAAWWYERGVEDGNIAGLDGTLNQRIEALRRISRRPRWLQGFLLRIYKFAWEEWV